MKSLSSVKEFIKSEFQGNPEKRQKNMHLLKSVAIFVGSVLFMRQYGEVMIDG
jgi:hypothetical protein